MNTTQADQAEWLALTLQAAPNQAKAVGQLWIVGKLRHAHKTTLRVIHPMCALINTVMYT